MCKEGDCNTAQAQQIEHTDTPNGTLQFAPKLLQRLVDFVAIPKPKTRRGQLGGGDAATAGNTAALGNLYWCAHCWWWSSYGSCHWGRDTAWLSFISKTTTTISSSSRRHSFIFSRCAKRR